MPKLVTESQFHDYAVRVLDAMLMGDAAPATGGTAMLTSKLYELMSQSYAKEYRGIIFRDLVPIVGGVPGAAGFQYIITDRDGEARRIASGSDDIPYIETGATDKIASYFIGGVGYRYTTHDLRAAMLGEWNPIAMKPIYSREACERYLQKIAFFGDKSAGIYGLLNNPAFTVVDSVSAGLLPIVGNGAQNAADVILYMINQVYRNSYQNHVPNIVPIALNDFQYIQQARMPVVEGASTGNVYGGQSVIQYIQDVYQKSYNRLLTFQPLIEMETANATGNGPRIGAYENDETNLFMKIPLEQIFYPPQQDNLTFKVPSEFEYSGVTVIRGNTGLYMDFPAAS